MVRSQEDRRVRSVVTGGCGCKRVQSQKDRLVRLQKGALTEGLQGAVTGGRVNKGTGKCGRRRFRRECAVAGDEGSAIVTEWCSDMTVRQQEETRVWSQQGAIMR